MIREATVSDASRIAEINVASWRFAYKGIVPEEYLYKEFLVENRIAVSRRWITEKRFEVYVYEDPATGIVKGMMGIGNVRTRTRTTRLNCISCMLSPIIPGRESALR